MDAQIARSCLRLGNHGVNIQLTGTGSSTAVGSITAFYRAFYRLQFHAWWQFKKARDPRHTLSKILKYRAETIRQGLHTRPQPNSIEIRIISKLSRKVPDSKHY